jgi:two-component sensor histidine kinase
VLTHTDRFVTFQFSVLDFTYPEKNRFRYKLENFDTVWIDSGTRNSATYTNLPAGDYVFRVQGANSAGIWNKDGITIDVHVLPPPWLTWWAFLLYGISLLFLVWVARRIYHSYVADRRAAQLEIDKLEAENRSYDDMQEQLELQDELVKSAYQHNMTTLSLISDCISHRGINPSDAVKRDLKESNVRRIAALSSLEDCLYYQAGGPVANLQKYTDSMIPVVLESSPIRPETIISINEVSSTLIQAKLATPLSIIIYELLENCMQHAFVDESPANYIHINMTHCTNPGSPRHCLKLSVRDSGIGIPGSVEDLADASSGIGIVKSIVEKLGGDIQFSGTTGTTVSITIPYPDDFPLEHN